MRAINPQLALWAVDMASALPTGFHPNIIRAGDSLLLDLLQNSIGVIASNQRDVFVGAQFR